MQDFPLTLPMVFRRFMRFSPDKLVVSSGPSGRRQHTWGQVGERTLRLCNAIKKLGAEPGDRVATFAWNSHRHLELYFSPCAGTVLHTLNIRLFPEQVTYIANHAEDKIIFLDASLTAALAPIKDQLRSVEHYVVMDDGGEVAPEFADAIKYEELIAAEDPSFDFPDIDERSAVAMCYTSGTTGNPKGVVYTHRSTVLHTMAAMMGDGISVREADVVLAIVPMFHANSWGLPYATAFAGANIVFPGADMSPGHIADLIQSEKVTIPAGVPTIWIGLEPILDAGSHDVSSVRAILCGGSAVPEGLIRRYAKHGLTFYHAWGMTETSPIASVYRVRSDLANAGEDEMFALNARQGIAAPGVEIRICDDDGNELPWDGKSVGEIEVRGPWITGSYYQPDDDANEAKFHDGWLRTGDVASIDWRGYITITDRTKDLVKSGGEWISTIELEGHLMAHPSVLEAAVIAVPHPKWDERPLALVVKRPDKDVTPDELIEFLTPRVAKWWLPDAVEFVGDIPKTSVGKFDKKVIREKYRDYSLPSA
jgi:fatty-acyl-CoA synthase